MQNNERQRSVHSPQNSTQRHITQLFGGVAAGREKLNYSIIQFSVRLPRCLVKFIIMTNIIFVRAARELIMLQFSTKFNFRSATDTIWLRTFDLHSMAMCKKKTKKNIFRVCPIQNSNINFIFDRIDTAIAKTQHNRVETNKKYNMS